MTVILLLHITLLEVVTVPWIEVTAMSQREEFVALARQEGANISRLAQRFGISRKSAYKWLARAAEGAPDWAADRSRRPATSPIQCAPALEEQVLAVRAAHPAWGGRKIRRRLQLDGQPEVPAASTITAILHRHGLIAPEESQKRGAMQRFERERPNELWQMDFKGPIPTAQGACHPLTIVDDHSRYALGVIACPNEQGATVRAALSGVFRRYGLPERMLMDNGSCWGKVESAWTLLEVWLLRLGVAVSHGRPFHPQTQGKCERFNQTLLAEALRGRNLGDLEEAQRVFDAFRASYNRERPHEGIGLEVPATRYRVSVFAYPETLAPIEYLSSDQVRKVGAAGYLSWRKGRYQVGRAFAGEPVALRATEKDGVWAVYYCQQRVATIDERAGACLQQD